MTLQSMSMYFFHKQKVVQINCTLIYGNFNFYIVYVEKIQGNNCVSLSYRLAGVC